VSIEYPDLPMSNSAARITVRRNDESYGPYSIEEVNQLLMAGRLDSDDLAWLEGTPDWTQLRTIPGVIAVPPVPRSDRDEYEDDPECSDRLILPAFLMAFFVGALGVHRFYVGKTGSGIAMLVLTLTIVGIFISGIWAFIDWIVIVSGSFRDSEDRLLKKWT
tara:strand:- start:28529 stop:29014 length:486 start_codon:yes stop_codon:yes gene_type:complete